MGGLHKDLVHMRGSVTGVVCQSKTLGGYLNFVHGVSEIKFNTGINSS